MCYRHLKLVKPTEHHTIRCMSYVLIEKVCLKHIDLKKKKVCAACIAKPDNCRLLELKCYANVFVFR